MNTATEKTSHRRLGLPLLGILGLALLAVPRVVLHDVGLTDEGTLVNALLVWIPPIVWIVVVVLLRVPTPFLALLAVGVLYGIFLAAGHQLLWNQAFPGGGPELGGNLAGLDPSVQGIIIRGFSTISSVVTGTLVGVLCGLVATGLRKLMDRFSEPEKTPR